MLKNRSTPIICASTLLLGSLSSLLSQAQDLPDNVPPEGLAPIADASDEPQKALQSFQLPEGVSGQVWAAEPLFANPVAFHVMGDESVLVAETFRHRRGVEDNRGHMYWLDEDIAAATTEDRLNMYKKWAKAGKLPMEWYTRWQDRVSWLWDSDGDGRADSSSVFATFNEALDGIGSGVIERNGTVYYTNIPHLWKLEDKNHDRVAEIKEPLFSGFGVKVSLSGHDMHGLKWGPDGRLYWSIGDRSYSTEGKEGQKFADAYSGAVFRCEPDGSNLEVFATGLRNPQELAFDDFGNLFSVDNDADGKDDTARVVYITEGSDTGWRMAYQYIGGVNANDDYGHGPWHAEGVWRQPWDGQPAYHTPPIGHVSEGPSGFVRYPGLGLPEKYQGAFFICDFRGGPGNSGIHSFHVTPKGAGFEVTESERFIWNVLPTDFDFDYSGGMLLADWVTGWLGEGKGRMFKFKHEASVQRDQAQLDQVQMYFEKGFENLCEADLLDALSFPDQRVRLEAQFTLENLKAAKSLEKIALESDHLLARVHAIWALSNLDRRDAYEIGEIAGLAGDNHPRIREQILKALGASADSAFLGALENGLQDEDPQVQLHAAMGIGKVGSKKSIPALTAWIESWSPESNDPFLRHAAVMAASGIASKSTSGLGAIAHFSQSASRQLRLVELLALRRLESPAIAKYLNDADPFLVQEAARAIYDKPISEAYPALAELIESDRTEIWNPMLYRRVVHANSRLGSEASLKRMAAVLGSANQSEFAKNLIFNVLNNWQNPDSKDAVMGMWRPMPERSTESMIAIVEPLISELLLKGTESIQNQAIEWAVRYQVKSPLTALKGIYENETAPEANRAAALKAIAALESEEKAIEITRRAAMNGQFPQIQAEAILAFSKLNPESALKWIQANQSNLPTVVQQAQVKSLGHIPGEESGKVLLSLAENLAEQADSNPAALELMEALELRRASEGRGNPYGRAVFQYQRAAREKGPLGRYELSILGGNAASGKNIFINKIETQCIRCHQADGEGSSVVGPNLSGLGKRLNRQQILEAIALPNETIAEGFENVALEMKDGSFIAGVLKKASKLEYLVEVPKTADEAVEFGSFEDAFSEDAFEEESTPAESEDLAHGNSSASETVPTELITVKIADVASMERGPSGMPAGLAEMLTASELRDLIEFLATQ